MWFYTYIFIYLHVHTFALLYNKSEFIPEAIVSDKSLAYKLG